MHVYLRGDWYQRLRLASGLVLFAFAATHFFNHALGLVGLEAMHQFQQWRTAVTRSTPGTLVLFLALVVHVTLALVKLARRTTWQLPRWEAVQIGLGLAIPFLLFPHIVNTRIAHSVFAVDDSYLYELVRLWPASADQQSILLLLVWIHGCIGLHYWLRLSARYRSIAPALLVGAVVLPVAAIAGFAVSGTKTAEIMADTEALAALKARSNWPDAAASDALAGWRLASRVAFGLAASAAIVVAVIRFRRHQERDTRVQVTYTSGQTVLIQPGRTVLEASRDAGILHASVCGGRARCSTCRVRIEKGLEGLTPPDEAEALTLQSIEAPANVRLACQVRPTTPITIALISAPGTPSPIESEFALVKEAVAYHVRAKLAGQPTEFSSSQEDEVYSWIRERVDYEGPVVRFSDPTITLAGARLDCVDGRTVGVLVLSRDEDLISIFIIPKGADNFEAINATRNGYHMLGWTEAQANFVAVIDPGLVGILPVETNTDQSDFSEIERLRQRSRSIRDSRSGVRTLDV